MSRVAPAVSVVVPVYNEEDSVRPLYEQVRDACDRLGRPYEIVLVDDGSSDSSWSRLVDLHAEDPRVRPVAFRKNYGQTAAMAAGFDLARGSVVVSMDGDLQNDPADIPRLVDKLDEGFDVVCGWRKQRQDRLLSRRVPSVVANWLIARITGVYIHDNGCSLKAYRADTIKNVRLYGEMHRFIPAMSTLTDARITEIVVNHRAREFGESKYGLSRIWRVMSDIVLVKMIIGFTSRPARWFGLLSFPFLLAGLLLLAGLSIVAVGGVTANWLVGSTVAMLLLFCGVNLLSLGAVGELARSTGDHSPRRLLRPRLRVLEMSHEQN